jgi:hypothetical protein
MQLSSGRGRGIRTPGPLLPKQVLYQAELCPDAGLADNDAGWRLGHPSRDA